MFRGRALHRVKKIQLTGNEVAHLVAASTAFRAVIEDGSMIAFMLRPFLRH